MSTPITLPLLLEAHVLALRILWRGASPRHAVTLRPAPHLRIARHNMQIFVHVPPQLPHPAPPHVHPHTTYAKTPGSVANTMLRIGFTGVKPANQHASHRTRFPGCSGSAEGPMGAGKPKHRVQSRLAARRAFLSRATSDQPPGKQPRSTTTWRRTRPTTLALSFRWERSRLRKEGHLLALSSIVVAVGWDRS